MILIRARHLAFAAALLVAALAATYGLVAYKFVPSAWRFVERRHPALDTVGTRAFTSAGIPGDPLNVGFVGSESALVQALLGAGWFPADPVTWRSSLRIAADSAARRPYVDAPVSPLFVGGHQQDLAFELPAAGDPSKRHHVRFWRSGGPSDALGRPLWIGAATFDAKVGFSHTTGQITHHIAPEVDAERDKLLHDLQQHQPDLTVHWEDGFQPVHEGRNGGGDRFVTDGRLVVVEGQ